MRLLWFVCWMALSEPVHAKDFTFMLADLQPYVIRGKNEMQPKRGLQVELLHALAERINHRILIEPIPTRRYLTGAYKPIFDGLVYADFLIERIPTVRDHYEVIGKVFRSRLLLFRKKQPGPPQPLNGIPAGTVGQIGNACAPFLKGDLSHLKQFDIKDPDQGVTMLHKQRLDYLCLSDTVIYRLMRRQNLSTDAFEALQVLGGFDLQLLLRKDLPESEKDLFRQALKSAWKQGDFQEIFLRYDVKDSLEQE